MCSRGQRSITGRQAHYLKRSNHTDYTPLAHLHLRVHAGGSLFAIRHTVHPAVCRHALQTLREQLTRAAKGKFLRWLQEAELPGQE